MTAGGCGKVSPIVGVVGIIDIEGVSGIRGLVREESLLSCSEGIVSGGTGRLPCSEKASAQMKKITPY